MKGNSMKAKRKTVMEPDEDGMLPDYDFSKGVRGKHAKRMRNGVNITIYAPDEKTIRELRRERRMLVQIEPDVAKHFTNASAVNSALRHVLAAASKRTLKKRAA
jgi:hypothetical protein